MSSSPDPESTEWSERLAEAMDARGLSGGELGRRAGFTAQYVNSLRSGERGARIPLDTARKLAAALGVSVDWLMEGIGPRERLSDVFPVGSQVAIDSYPGRAEAIALLSGVAEPEVLAALRAAAPAGGKDPGREWWIAYARTLTQELRRIQDDPVFGGEARASGAMGEVRAGERERPEPPKSEYAIKRKR
jgi:transcriptional regulator with XRE-family HTH domain